MRSVNLRSSEDKNARQFDKKKKETMTTDLQEQGKIVFIWSTQKLTQKYGEETKQLQ